MYYYIEGTVAQILPNCIVIDCGGVGYALFASKTTLAAARPGTKQKLYTYLNVREDTMDLYGFSDMREKLCFTMLLGISGVGPKAALSILSVASPDRFAVAVLNEDEKLLTQAAGVGKKLAQRVILELKDKLAKEFGASDSGLDSAMLAANTAPGVHAAVSALMVLGYSRQEAARAVELLGDVAHLQTEEIVRLALKNT